MNNHERERARLYRLQELAIIWAFLALLTSIAGIFSRNSHPEFQPLLFGLSLLFCVFSIRLHWKGGRDD